MSHTPVKKKKKKKKPDPDQPEIKFADQPDPKVFLKMFPDPGPVSVWSVETWGFRLPRRSYYINYK